jgi:hypothetical protein
MDDKIKENEMSRACSAHGGGDKCFQNFGWKARREETILKAWE